MKTGIQYYQFTSRFRSRRQWVIGFNLGTQEANAKAVLSYAFRHNADPKRTESPTP